MKLNTTPGKAFIWSASIMLLVMSVWLPELTSAAQTEPVCLIDRALSPPSAAQVDPLAGRLGGTRESFEARFGSPIDDDFFIEYEVEGCEVLVSYYEGVLTDVSVYFPGFADDRSEWTISQAMQVAERLLPLDVQMAQPYRNVTFVEHHECYSQALAERVPFTAYEYVDNNPTAGQCSAVYSLDLDGIYVQSLTVQLQIEDPN